MTTTRAAPQRPGLGVVLLLALALCGCAQRPGLTVLDPVTATPGAKLVSIYVATTRSVDGDDAPRPTNAIAVAPSYLRYVVSIPPTHRPAQIEWPSGAPDPTKDFAVVSSERLEEDQMVAELGAAAARGDVMDREVHVFVHGFNNSFQESLFRMAQLVADADVGRAAVLFSWPSKAAVTGYLADKEAVTFSRDALAHVLARLAAERRIRDVRLVAHSMGSWLAMESVRQIRIARNAGAIAKLDVALAAPDIDSEVFLQQLRVVGRLRAPITVLVSKDDQALSLSRLLAGGQFRAGAADVDDPRVLAEARNANVRAIDISVLGTRSGAGHDGFAAYAAIYGRLQKTGDDRLAAGVGPGVYVLDSVGRVRPVDARIAQAAGEPDARSLR
ncbi:alpha/beta hydrolase [Chenggangzhangella methanolivorans]|uniref:Alpha/beta fold hydrolase n=1 Tax=Chenggangzhangella methanolivorans TaxID=1437009 RepID=A0A9E6UR26_9HYPH|nr:alpha/beta fold hydrolase [Chenggangzhangella methanolivorans]QZO01790.1 alpha/beta fold hydrolase [Chenggangzhangella methanolivorans]